jgi:hypothetical protein
MRPHVSAEAMARYRQGDLNQRRTSHIGAHLAGCERCSALSEDLGGVTTLLASAQPPPMPEDLTARITGALAAESARRAAAPDAGKAAAAAPARHRRSPRLPGLPHIAPRVALGGLAAAAALVLVAGGLYEIVARSGPPASSASSGVPSAARHAAGSASNGLLLPASPVFGPALQYRHSGRTYSISPISSSTQFTQPDLTSQVSADVKKYGAGFTKTGPNAESLSRSGPASPAAEPREQSETFASLSVAALRGCVDRVAAGSLVLLVDVAHYRDQPATVIVTRAAETGPMEIWVVGAGCSASSSDVLQRATAAAP